MEKLSGKTLNLTNLNVEIIKDLFPEVITDGKIDFEHLRLILGDNVDSGVEKYQFSWNGKSDTIRFSQSPSTGTLLPVKHKSHNWENTKNLYIEGDNVEVLKLLQKSYFGKIQMIFIDPPYNTGHDFVYKDNFVNNIENYKQITNQANHATPETSGRYHTDWLNMMYSRLVLARNLLSDNGIICITIGEHEIENLKKICCEIFGDVNYIETYIWESTFRPDNSSKINRRNTEYVVCVAKNIESISSLTGIVKAKEGLPSLTKSSMKASKLTFPANTVKTYLEDGTYSKGKKDSYELLDDVEVKNGVIVNEFSLIGHVIWGQQKLLNEIENGTEIIIKNESFVPYTKKVGDSITAPTKLIPHDYVGDVLSANAEMAKLFDEKVFSYPKPVSLIKYLIKYVDSNEFTVLDFFSGSGTTAQAVLELNSEFKEKNLNYILVQLPENLDENYKSASDKEKPVLKNAINLCEKIGFDHSICSIAIERIKRAGSKVYTETKNKFDKGGLFSENLVNPDSLDLGFKVFKLDSTNIRPWDSSIQLDEYSLLTMNETIKDGRSKLDVAYEIMLKYGVFDMPLKEVIISNKTMYDIGDGYMIICLENDITMNDVAEIAKLKPHCVVFKEDGFKDDNEKMNATYTLERFKVEKVLCI